MKTAVLGPWQRGLNLVSSRDLSAFLSPNELGNAVNVTVTNQGFLEPRPGMHKLKSNELDSIIDSYGGKLKPIGTVRDSQGQKVLLIQCIYSQVAPAKSMAILFAVVGSYITEVGQVDCTEFPEGFTCSIQIDKSLDDSTVFTTGIILYTGVDTKAYYLKEPLNILSPTNPFTKVPESYNIPPTDYVFIFKDRVISVSRTESSIYTSPVGRHFRFDDDLKSLDDPAKPAEDVAQQFMVDPAFKDEITSVELYNSAFYIFKKRSTFVFSYQADPKDDGYLRNIDNKMGAFATVVGVNGIYVVNTEGVYLLQGATYANIQPQLNLKLYSPLSDSDLNYKTDVFLTLLHKDTLVLGIRDVKNGLYNPDEGIYLDEYTDEYPGGILLPEGTSVSSKLDGYTDTYGTMYGFRTISEYYAMNVNNGAWTSWFFEYETGIDSFFPSGPGTRFFETGYYFDKVFNINYNFITMDGKGVGYFEGNHVSPLKYLDVIYTNNTAKGMIPPVSFQLKTLTDDSFIRYLKIYKAYIRGYISDLADGDMNTKWLFKFNYNKYLHEPSMNPSKFLKIKFHTKGQYKIVNTVPLPMLQHRVSDLTIAVSREATALNLYTEVFETHQPTLLEALGYYFSYNTFLVEYEAKAGV